MTTLFCQCLNWAVSSSVTRCGAAAFSAPDPDSTIIKITSSGTPADLSAPKAAGEVSKLHFDLLILAMTMLGDNPALSMSVTSWLVKADEPLCTCSGCCAVSCAARAEMRVPPTVRRGTPTALLPDIPLATKAWVLECCPTAGNPLMFCDCIPGTAPIMHNSSTSDFTSFPMPFLAGEF